MKSVLAVVSQLVVGMVLSWGCQACSAGIITVPPDLQPGDQYRLAFVTSTLTRADSADIAYYNSFVTNVANSAPGLAALNTTWSVIGSTQDVDARDNTQTNPTLAAGVPIYNLAAERLASDNADFWDGRLATGTSVHVAENNEYYEVYVWTGTMPDGVASAFILGADFFGIVLGRSSGSGSSWITNSIGGIDQELRIYGMSGVLTVVPEPSAFLLGGAALVALVVFGRRRRELKPAD